MNTPTPDEEIEALLGRLTPAPPDPALMARLRTALPAPPKIIRFARWTPLAAAAGIAFAFALSLHPKPEVAKSAPESEPRRVPIESRQRLMEVADLGVISDKNRQPVRLVRTTWVDEIIYGSEPMSESRVRQEILPVALRTY